MSRILLFSLWALSCSPVLFGQSTNYHSIFTAQTQWNLFVLNYSNGSIVPAIQKVTKDTAMSGKSHMVFAPDATVPNRNNAYVSEDSAEKKVYVTENNETFLLYDFTLKKGDVFKCKDLDFEVLSASDFESGEGSRKRIELKCLTKLADNLVWIEGVGATISPLYYKHYASTTQDVKVTCFFRGQKLVYSLSDEPCAVPVGSNDIHSGLLRMQVSPNPFSENLSVAIQNPDNEDLTLQLYSTTGVQLYSEKIVQKEQETTLNLGFNDLMSGIYLLHIRSGSSTVTTRIVKQ